VIGTNIAAAITPSGDLDEIAIQKQTAVFHWKDVCYDMKVKGQPRRLLDHVDGWVKPGTLTALMVHSDVSPEKKWRIITRPRVPRGPVKRLFLMFLLVASLRAYWQAICF
jgi:hypothetical protein